MVSFITQVNQHRQLFGMHLLSNLLQHFGGRSLMRQRSDNNFTPLHRVHGTGFDAAASGFVNLTNVSR